MFSSATLKTVQHGLAAIHGHLRSRGLACSFEVVLHRGHCRPATVSPQGLCVCMHDLYNVRWALEGQIAVYVAMQEEWKGYSMALSSCQPSPLAPITSMGLIGLRPSRTLTRPAPSQERIAAGGEEHDTIKPLAEHLGGDAQNVVLVDDEAWKAAPGERGRLLLVPSWDAAGADAGAGDRVRITGN